MDEPEFGAELLGSVPPAGRVPHGDPLGVVPGVLVVFGLTVEGSVLLPDDGGLVEFAPGTFEGGAEPVGGGTVELVGGAVGELVGGAVVEGCVAEPGVVEPGVAELGACAWPVAGELPAGAVPPEGLLWATAQVAQERTTDRIASLFADIEASRH